MMGAPEPPSRIRLPGVLTKPDGGAKQVERQPRLPSRVWRNGDLPFSGDNLMDTLQKSWLLFLILPPEKLKARESRL
jgi:hypothetical protein